MADSPATKKQKKAMLSALEASLGVVTSAAKKVGINPATHYGWVKKDEAYAEAVDAIQDTAIDFVESKLFSQIKDGNTTATIFYLKTKAKHRGYVERAEFDHTTNGKDLTPVVLASYEG